MTASWYKLELETRYALEADGYWCIRPGGSKGAADVLAMKPRQLDGRFKGVIMTEILFVQCKESGQLLPLERIDLFGLAERFSGTALVARWHKPGRAARTVEFRQLTGPGPRDWQPWTPNHAIGAEQ